MRHNYNLSDEDIRNEIWKDIENYVGLYQISNMGRVKSLIKSKRNSLGDLIMNAKVSKKGYRLISLLKEDRLKSFRICRLVGIHFIANPENRGTINHKKGNKLDDRAGELEWNTLSENSKHSFSILNRVSSMKGKMSKKRKRVQQLTLDGILINTFDSQMEAGKTLNIGYQHISSVCIGKRKQAYGFIWKFIE